MIRNALVAALASFVVAGCPGAAPPPAPAVAAVTSRQAVAVSVEAARRASVQRTVNLLGTLYGDEEATVSNEVAGRIVSLSADVGDVFSAGAVLAELDKEDLLLEETAAHRALDAVLARLGVSTIPDSTFNVDALPTVARAQAQLENAKAKWDRLLTIQKKGGGIISDQDVKDAETNAAVASATLDGERVLARSLIADARHRDAEIAIARRRLLDTRVVAPEGAQRWSVASRHVSKGEFLKQGSPLFRLVSLDPIKLRAAAPERYLPDLARDQEAHVTVDAWGDRRFPGKLSRIAPAVDPASRSFAVEILVPNRSGELRPGSFARASVLTRREEAILVPLESVVSYAGVTKVFIIDRAPEGTVARERIVVAGARKERHVEVTGVREGDMVLTRGQTVVADGSPVSVAEAAPDKGEKATTPGATR